MWYGVCNCFSPRYIILLAVIIIRAVTFTNFHSIQRFQFVRFFTRSFVEREKKRKNSLLPRFIRRGTFQQHHSLLRHHSTWVLYFFLHNILLLLFYAYILVRDVDKSYGARPMGVVRYYIHIWLLKYVI